MFKKDQAATIRTLYYFKHRVTRKRHEISVLYALSRQADEYSGWFVDRDTFANLIQKLSNYKKPFDKSIFYDRLGCMMISESEWEKYALRAKVVFKSFVEKKEIPAL